MREWDPSTKTGYDTAAETSMAAGCAILEQALEVLLVGCNSSLRTSALCRLAAESIPVQTLQT
jgi:hypothetical protein